MAKRRAAVKKAKSRKVSVKSSSYSSSHHDNNTLLLILAGVVVVILCLYLLGMIKFNQFNANQYMSGNQMFRNNVQYNVNQETVMPSPAKDSLQHP